MNRIIINVIVLIFVIAMLVLALFQGTAPWGTGLLGIAVGAMIVTVLPWHAKGGLSTGAAFGLKLVGSLILLGILIAGIATDWTSRETALMGIAAGAVLAATFQSRPGSAAQ